MPKTPRRTVDCSRCGKIIDSPPPEPSEMTAGYYIAAGHQQFANPGEVYVCDACMWADPRYIAVHGRPL
jgi:hypothetical protein